MNAKNWKYAAIPTLFVAFLAIYPQLNFWLAKGSTWQGAYFVANFDEVAYSAYVNALIDGKPRKYDAYLAAESPHESLYSIQFIPAYSIALPARLLGISASTAFIILNLLAAAAAAFFIFWLLFNITSDALWSATGAILVCCLGTAVAFEGELRYWLQGQILVDFFPFLRRYQPGFGFPFFFLFCGLVWCSLTVETKRKTIVYSLLSGGIFAALVYCYFFLWTSAAAWLACVNLLFFVWHREKASALLTNFGIVTSLGIAALIPYFLMLSNRSEHIDSIQLLRSTHLPDLDSPSLIIGIMVAIAIVIFVRRGGAAMASPRTLVALAFALTPVVLFNQQIVTGHSLQPIHYEVFIANYLVLTSLALLLSFVFRAEGRRRVLLYVAILAAGWGVVEATGSTKRSSSFADLRDISVPAIRYIAEQEKQSPTQGAVYASNTGTADFVPTIVALRPLWTSHSSMAGGMDIAENKRLFYCFLYYGGFTEKDLAERLRGGAFEETAAIFGSERALPELGKNIAAVTALEIATEARAYANFASSFSRSAASDPVLSYLIVPADDGFDFTNFDKWYERDAGAVTGDFKVYKLKLRP